MTATPKPAALVGTAAVALLAGVLLGRPELAAVGAAFAVVAARGALGTPPRIEGMAVHAEPTRMLEGDTVRVRVEIRANGAARAVVTLLTDERLAPTGGGVASVAVACEPNAAVTIPLVARRWGRVAVRSPTVRALDRAGLRVVTAIGPAAGTVRVLPDREHLRTLLQAPRTQARTGSQVARERGEGSELAELRPLRTGDPRRRIAWRASARRGELVVADRHADRNADIVLLLDTFAEVRRGADGTLGAAVRAAAALADAHLSRQDRVAVVGFGGVLHTLAPSMGTAAAYRVLDALVDSEVVESYAEKDVAVIPPRVLPARSLVVALSPLLDPRGIAGLLDLRARGFEVAVLDVSPEPYLAKPRGKDEMQARRLWRLHREALRSRLRRAGAAVTTLDESRPLAVPIEEVTRWRRYAAPAAPPSR